MFQILLVVHFVYINYLQMKAASSGGFVGNRVAQ